MVAANSDAVRMASLAVQGWQIEPRDEIGGVDLFADENLLRLFGLVG